MDMFKSKSLKVVFQKTDAHFLQRKRVNSPLGEGVDDENILCSFTYVMQRGWFELMTLDSMANELTVESSIPFHFLQIINLTNFLHIYKSIIQFQNNRCAIQTWCAEMDQNMITFTVSQFRSKHLLHHSTCY